MASPVKLTPLPQYTRLPVRSGCWYSENPYRKAEVTIVLRLAGALKEVPVESQHGTALVLDAGRRLLMS